MKTNILSSILAALVISVTPLSRADGTNSAGTPAAGEVKPYPLKTCVVSGETLGEMGEPVRIVYNGQEIKFCCKECVGKFKKSPDKFLKKLDQAKISDKKP